MAAPATAEPGPLEQARAAAAALSSARIALSDRIIQAESRFLGARDRRATRAVAQQMVDRLVAHLAAQAENFGAGLVVATGNKAEGEVWRTLVATPGIAVWAAFDPDRVRAWMLAKLDREAAMFGGWSEITQAEADERQRQAEADGISLERYGDEQPGGRTTVATATTGDPWRAGHTVTEHRR